MTTAEGGQHILTEEELRAGMAKLKEVECKDESLSYIREVYEENELNDFDDYVCSEPLLQVALTIAAERHAGQSRKYKDVPFLNHPYETAFLLWQHLKDNEDVAPMLGRIVAVGFLHDVVEENPDFTIEDLTDAMLTMLWGDANNMAVIKDIGMIASQLTIVTPSPIEGYETKDMWVMRKGMEVKLIMRSGGPDGEENTDAANIARAVKIADVMSFSRELKRDHDAGLEISDSKGHDPVDLRDYVNMLGLRMTHIRGARNNPPFLNPLIDSLESAVMDLEDSIAPSVKQA